MHASSVRPNPTQRTAATITRAIAHRNPHLRRTRESLCERQHCFVAWAGEEADCWNCGLPATHRSNRRGSALQRLLAGVDSHVIRSRNTGKAAQA
ncbi:hypothetical protein [Streptomyces sp. NPDC002133]|uniref:hypothetical protein n=1 Tax=Streptomyces sp. NPDC002133 TaxID=3154409 RepID=UPI00332122D3